MGDKVKAIFEKACPNCGGPISDKRLELGLPCSKCLPRIEEEENQDHACVELEALNKLKGDFKEICNLKTEIREFDNFFWSIHKSHPWSLQKAWFKRFYLGRSFALLAPTGIGKTTFGLTLSYYLAKKKNKKSYLIFPTRLLVEQAINKLRKMGVPEEYMLYFGEKPSLTKKQREERLKRLQKGDFKILISTSMFLYRNIEHIPKGVFSLVFVDDVDSFLKTAKNIDKALYLLGFTEKDIEWAFKIIRLRKELTQKPNASKEEWEKLRKEEEKLKKHAEKVRKGVLIVSSATSNPRSERIKLFRELLGFEVGRPLFYLRNVVDAYEDKFLNGKKSIEDHKPLWDFVAQFVKEHPKGGLIYVSQDRGKEEVDRLVEYLNSKGLKVVSYEEMDKHLKEYEEGKVNALVGIASYRNPLARGFDMPHVVRYALFVGAPKLKFTLKVEEHISHILWALVAIRPLIAKDKKLRERYLQKLDRWIERLRKYSYLSEEFIERNERLKEIIENIRNEVREFIENPEILERIKESDEITLKWDEKDGYSLIVADVTGYLQASGRVSRLYAGGLTKGFSLVLVDDIKAFNNLQKKVKWFSDEIEFVPLKEVDLKTLFEEIERDRQKVERFLKGEIPEEVKELIKPVLVIVESPNKARTIANFFGKPLRRRVGEIDVMEVSLGDKFLTITASAGHVYDLIKKNEGNIFHGVIVEGDKKNPRHFIPIYEPIEQETPEGEIRTKEEIIESLRQAGLEVAEVYIGTDPDSITGDSKVLVKVNGEIKHLTVEELFEQLKEKHKIELRNGHEYIEPKDLEVVVVDKDYRVRFGKAKYLIRHKVRKPIYRITTQSGRDIKITGDHSIFRLDENLNLQEVKPTFLREGDFIVVNETLPKEALKLLNPQEVEKLKTETSEGRKIGDIREERITKIEKLPLEEQYVYDFETETQNFVANNILCHNTEGEKIAWDLYEVLKPYQPNIRRMEFHEVTKRAIIEAIYNPREMDINLVEAQMVRRIADRWVGFELSRLLQEHFKKPWLSAGRVQTPVLGWVIERDKQYRTKKGAVFVYLPNPEKDKRRVSVSWEFEDKKLAKEFFKNLQAVEVKITDRKDEEKKPAPPFTTDAMLKEASEKLRFSASKTMQLAQELFEMGLCVTGDTQVVLRDGGIKPIKEIVENSRESSLLGFEDENLKVCCADATKFWRIPYKGELKVIKLSNGLEIKATPDHALFVYRDGKFGWVSAKNLKEGDYIAAPFGYRKDLGRELTLLELLLELGITDVMLQFRDWSEKFRQKVAPIIKKHVKSSVKYKYLRREIVPLSLLAEHLTKEEILHLADEIVGIYPQRAGAKPIPLFELNKDFWYFVGLVLGDGSLSQPAKVTIAQTPTKRVKEFLENLFPFLKVSEQSNGSVVIYSSLLHRILGKLGTRKGELNPLIFTLKEEYINALIAGYFDTDGTASLMHDKNSGKPNLRVVITSKRHDVLEKLHIYLNSVGIQTSLRGTKSRTAKDLIFSNLTIDRFAEKIGKHLRIRKEQFQKAFDEYRKHHKKVFEDDILPFADIVKKLQFPKGAKFKLLKGEGIDVWNYLRDNGKKRISRSRLRKIVETLKGENAKDEVLQLLEHLVNEPLTWVKVERIESETFEGYLYDFTTTKGSFIANGLVSHNCTYHRTDSTRVSDVGIALAREYIDENFGSDYFYPRHWGEGGAHECIRPTHPWDVEELRSMMLAGQIQRLTRDHLRLYELIFKRFMASQMRPAQVEVSKFEVLPLLENKELPAPKVEREEITSVLRDGFNLMTPIEVYYLKEGTFRVVEQKEFTDEEGNKLEEHSDSAMKIYKLVPLAYPYTQGSLIEEMKKRGIGRPSTYAQIVQKLLDRGYVIERKNFLFPTKLGKEVYSYLIRLKEAEKFVKEEFTRILEELMDKIERGGVYYIDVLKDLYEEVLRIEKLKVEKK